MTTSFTVRHSWKPQLKHQPSFLGAFRGHASVQQVGHVTYSQQVQSQMGELQSCPEAPANISCTDECSSEVGMQLQKILRKLQAYVQFSMDQTNDFAAALVATTASGFPSSWKVQ